jgi:hypothetical protein
MSYSFWVNYVNSWLDLSEMGTFVRYLKLPTIHVNAISITQTCLSCPKSNCLPFKQLLINWQRSLTLLLQYPWLCYNSVFLDNTLTSMKWTYLRVNYLEIFHFSLKQNVLVSCYRLNRFVIRLLPLKPNINDNGYCECGAQCIASHQQRITNLFNL